MYRNEVIDGVKGIVHVLLLNLHSRGERGTKNTFDAVLCRAKKIAKKTVDIVGDHEISSAATSVTHEKMGIKVMSNIESNLFYYSV